VVLLLAGHLQGAGTGAAKPTAKTRWSFGEPLYFAASDKPPNRDRILTPPQNRNQHIHPCQVWDQAIMSVASIDRDVNTGQGGGICDCSPVRSRISSIQPHAGWQSRGEKLGKRSSQSVDADIIVLKYPLERRRI
jgi:hypothetical protein